MMPEIRSCEDALRMLADHLDGELHGAPQQELEHHLEKCRSCFSRAEFERGLKEKVAATGRQAASPALTRRIQTMIREFAVSDME